MANGAWAEVGSVLDAGTQPAKHQGLACARLVRKRQGLACARLVRRRGLGLRVCVDVGWGGSTGGSSLTRPWTLGLPWGIGEPEKKLGRGTWSQAGGEEEKVTATMTVLAIERRGVGE